MTFLEQRNREIRQARESGGWPIRVFKITIRPKGKIDVIFVQTCVHCNVMMMRAMNGLDLTLIQKSISWFVSYFVDDMQSRGEVPLCYVCNQKYRKEQKIDGSRTGRKVEEGER